MTSRQLALLYWRALLAELPVARPAAPDSPEGVASGQRFIAVRKLFFELLELEGASDLFEIGAHEASASRSFVEGHQSRRAHAYEASPVVFKSLAAAVKGSRIFPHNKAVGAQPGRVQFFMPKEARFSQLGSIRERIRPLFETDAADVEVVTLEQAAREASIGQSRSCGLWIDVEGAEMDVLRGGRAFVRESVGAIYIEVSDDLPYQANAHPLDLFAELLKAGFIPLCRDCQFQRTYNVLFAHEDVAYRQFEAISRFSLNARLTT